MYEQNIPAASYFRTVNMAKAVFSKMYSGDRTVQSIQQFRAW